MPYQRRQCDLCPTRGGTASDQPRQIENGPLRESACAGGTFRKKWATERNVPAAIGAAIAWLASLGISSDADTTAALVAGATGLATAAYYTLRTPP